MYRRLSLSRDPYAPVADGDLFWESPAREAVRRDALEALRSGQGVWLTGPPGSGRPTVLRRLAEEFVDEGRCALWLEGPLPEDGGDLLRRLAEVAGTDSGPAEDPVATAGALYRRILGAFCQTGTVAVVPGGVLPGAGPLAELAILAELRVAGCPLACVALCGEAGPPPVPGAVSLALSAPRPSEVREFLLFRAAQCGRPDLLSPETLDRIGARAVGFGDALGRARAELARRVFHLSAQAEAPVRGPREGSLFDPDEIEAVDRLLTALSSEEPSGGL